MPTDIDLILPAAGTGSRFGSQGFVQPKPLLDLGGRPFFWWAVESVRRVVKIRQMVFVVLQDHVRDFEIDSRIRSFYPQATIVPIAQVTSGAAETASMGLQALADDGPLAINDCDHAFMCSGLPGTVAALRDEKELAAALMCFRSSSKNYSYARLDAAGKVIGTAEKQVVSPFAIAGCYLFSSADRFNGLYQGYREHCRYDELFMSGLYNLAADRQLPIGLLEVDRHWSFGTPEELKRLTPEVLGPCLGWK